MLGSTNAAIIVVPYEPVLYQAKYWNNSQNYAPNPTPLDGGTDHSLFTAPSYKFNLKIAIYANTKGANTGYLKQNGSIIRYLNSAWNDRLSIVDCGNFYCPGQSFVISLDGLPPYGMATYTAIITKVD